MLFSASRIQLMTLRQKILLIIGVTFVILIGIIYSTSATILHRDFSQFERRETYEHIKRVQEALSNELVQLNQTNRSWAEWDKTYNFINNANKAYIKTYLNNVNGSILNINFLLYIDSSGQIVFDKGFDLTERKSIEISHNLKQYFSSQSFWHDLDKNHFLKGIIILAENPILITSSPILKNDPSGTNRGTLMMGRYLDTAAIKRLGKQTHLSIAMYTVNDEMPTELGTVRSALLTEESILVRPLNQQTIAGYSLIKDIYGQPALIVRVAMPRIHQQGGASIGYLLLSVLVVGLVFSIVILLLLEQ